MKTIVKSSISISSELFEKLEEAAGICSIKPERLLKRVIKKYLNTLKRAEVIHGNTIKYNKRNRDGYLRKTVRWTAAEYSILLQSRFYMRLSVSLIVSWAIEGHLEKVVRATLKLKSKVKNNITEIFNKPITISKQFLIYWPFIDTREVPFLAQRWNTVLF